jgi:alanine racemase
MKTTPLTRIEINLDNLKYNIQSLKNFITPKVDLMVVVKSNAYGHGMVEIAQEAVRAGADALAVFTVDEGLLLRKSHIRKPILVFGPFDESDAYSAVMKNLTLTVWDRGTARNLSKAAIRAKKRAAVHLKVNTGMNRLGVEADEAMEFVQYLKRLPKLDLEGIYSHFASAGSTNKAYTFQQLGIFQDLLIKLDREGLKPKIAHIANSAAALEVPSSHLSMVRSGIAVYGLFSNSRLSNYFDLKPVLEFKTTIVEMRKLPGGQKISYDGTYTTSKPTMIAVVPVGYAHGYDFRFSNRGKMLVAGQRVAVIGRVCMEMTMLDVTDIPEAKVGDEVVVLGQQNGQNITAGELAGYLDTINYEIVSKLPDRLERIYVRTKNKKR